MKHLFAFLTVAAFGVVEAAVPRIVDNSVSFVNRKVGLEISYALEGCAGIVTADVLTNGVSVGDAALADLKGDVNALVPSGARKKFIWPHTLIDADLTSVKVDVVVTVVAEQLPPDYMVVDLSSGAVAYYRSAAALPGGLDADVYRKTKMVFRKISAANRIWRIGDSRVLCRDSNEFYTRNRTGLVSLSYDYWMGVFELTHAQVRAVTGSWAPAHIENVPQGSTGTTKNRRLTPNEDDWSMCPADGMSVTNMRGNPANASYLWPQMGRGGVDPNSFLGILRSRTGNRMYFDMPTSAEWEYAARGGRSEATPWGVEAIVESDVGKYAWMLTNAKTGDFIDQYGAGRTQRAGGKLPNDWGLYDMLGNLYEVTLDYNPADAYLDSEDRPYELDPVGVDRTKAASGYLRKIRGGCYSDSYQFSRVTRVSVGNLGEGSSGQWFGFRIACPIAWKPHAAVESDQPTIAFDADTREATIAYRLTGTEPKIVTIDVKTNGVTIGAANFAYLSGDVNRVVTPGYHVVYWRPDHTWPGHVVDTSVDSLSVEVREFATNNPPAYAVLNLSGKMTPMYYESAEAIPGGVTNIAYKSDSLVLKKIPAAGVIWRMGCNWAGRDGAELGHLVQLTHDYWMAVYGMTQRQYRLVKGSLPAWEFYGTERSDLPVLNVSWNMVRGGTWPSANGHADSGASTLVTTLRSWFPTFVFDLPTEAQREFAARGGRDTVFEDGSNSYTLDAARIGKFSWNSDTNSQDPDNVSGKPHAVGLLAANGFGLYDMSGNELEWCLDRYAADICPSDGTITVDPEGPTTGDVRVVRGCAFSDGWASSRVHRRGSVGPSTADRWRGFRLAAPVAP